MAVVLSGRSDWRKGGGEEQRRRKRNIKRRRGRRGIIIPDAHDKRKREEENKKESGITAEGGKRRQREAAEGSGATCQDCPDAEALADVRMAHHQSDRCRRRRLSGCRSFLRICRVILGLHVVYSLFNLSLISTQNSRKNQKRR